MKKYHKLLLLSIPLLFGAFLLFMIHYSMEHKESAAESETEIVGCDDFLGEHGVFAKEHTGSQYTVTLARCSGFRMWAGSLHFWPPSSYDSFPPVLIAKFSVTCSKEDYEKLEIGDYVDCAGFYDFPPDDFDAGHGELTKIQKSLGPMVYDPDGFILWLYRDLTKE